MASLVAMNGPEARVRSGDTLIRVQCWRGAKGERSMRPTQWRARSKGEKRGAMLQIPAIASGALAIAIGFAAQPALGSPQLPDASQGPQRRLNVVSALKTVEHGSETVITLGCSTKPLFSVFKLERPMRLTLDLANAELRHLRPLTDVGTWAVSQVATTQFRTNATTIARVMVSFRRRASYRVKAVGRRVIITITPHDRKPVARSHDKALRREARQARREASMARQVLGQARREATRLEREARQTEAQARRSEARHAAAKGRVGALADARARRRMQTLGERALVDRKRAQRANAAAAAAQQRSHELAQEAARAQSQALSVTSGHRTTNKSYRTAGRRQGVHRAARVAALAPRTPLAAPGAPSRASIRNVLFADRHKFAEVKIVIEGRPSYELHRQGAEQLLVLKNAGLPQLLRRTLDTSAFGGPVKAVSSFVTNESTGLVYVKVDLERHQPGRVVRTAEGLVLRFAKTTARAATTPQDARAGTDSGNALAPLDQRYQSTSVAAAGGASRRFKNRRYLGRRIDLDFKDADIHNILRLLSQVGNVNIVTSDDVRGRVTIRMRNVPWDQALDVVLRAKGLGQVREGNLIRVAPMADLEKERESEIARLKQMALLKPLETRLIPLSYAQAQAVLPKLQYTLGPRGKLTFDERTNMIIARDIAGNLNLMEKMIRNLDTQTPQVMIEARIIEARTNYTKELGIQWGGAFAATSANGNSTGLAFPNQIGIGGGASELGTTPTDGILLGQAANPNFVVNMPASAGNGSGGAIGLTLGSVSGAFNVNLRLSAAETKGDIRIVSAPRITTLDNVEAKIEQGVSIPFSQVSAAGVQTSFQDAKLNLTVRPHVTADGSVIMKVKVERNEPDFTNTGARGQPTILKKQAETEMLVKDGDTAVIGGIYTTRDGRSWSKVPWLAEIPVIGWFFKTRRDTSDREEVLVFITPRIINRAQSIGR